MELQAAATGQKHGGPAKRGGDAHVAEEHPKHNHVERDAEEVVQGGARLFGHDARLMIGLMMVVAIVVGEVIVVITVI